MCVFAAGENESFKLLYTESNGFSVTLQSCTPRWGLLVWAWTGQSLTQVTPAPGKGRRAASGRQTRADATLQRKKPHRVKSTFTGCFPPTPLSRPLQRSLPASRCPRTGLRAPRAAANGSRRPWEANDIPCLKSMADSRTCRHRGDPKEPVQRSNSERREPKFLRESSTMTVWNLVPSQLEGLVDTSVLCEPQEGHV